MKTPSLFLTVLLACLGATAQNVGIGTSSPLAALMINTSGNILTPQLHVRQTNTGDYARLRLQSGTSRYWDIAGYNGAAAPNDLLNIYNSGVGDILSITGSGNVGIGNNAPSSRLTVNGNTSTSTLTITGTGNPFDFLIRVNANGDVSSRKGFGALGLKYCIAVTGIFPSRSGTDVVLNGTGAYIGEIMLFAGNFAPTGWMFCEGQLLPIASYTALFSLLGTQYGGNGQTTFALPDLRSAVPVHAGTPLIGQTWDQGERVY